MNSSGVWSPVRGLLDDVRHQFPALMAITGALMAAGALAEGLGLLILAPMLSAGSGHGGGFVAVIAGRLPGVDSFLSIMMLFLLIMIVRAGVIYARDFANAKLEASYEANLRLRVATTLAKRGWPFAATLGQAKMQSILSHDVPRAGLGVHHGLSATTSGFMILVQLAVAAYLSWPMALGALALLSFGLPWFLRLARRGHANADELMASREESTKGAFVFHAGLKAALAQGSTASFLTSFRSNLAREIGSMVRFAAALARLRARHAVGAAVAVAILVTAGRQLELDLPRLLAMLVVFVRMNSPVQSFQQGLIGLVSSGVPFAKIQRELSTLVAPGDFQQPAPPLAWHELTATRLALDRGGGSGLPATSFTLARGEWVCVAGQSGAGKTTLIDLVVGLLEPTSGQILVDRTPLDAERRRQWSATLSYVGQQDAPFDDTVRAALGSGDEAACWKALDTVGLAELVQRSPMGLETSLNDRGARLSGGERQRLLIARALLRDPTLLILDEATAALDVSAEREVVRSVRDRYPDMAALLVAHRAETVALCDRIVTVGQ